MSNNPNAYAGMVPCGVMGNGDYRGRLSRYVHTAADSNPIYKYQFVARTGAGDSTSGLPVVSTLSNVYSDITGIVVGMEPVAYPSLNTMYCPASTYRVLLVADDPVLWFTAIGDDVGTTLAISHQGQNIQYTPGTPSTITGHSNDRLDSSTVGTAAQDGSSHNRNIRLVKLSEIVGRNIGTTDMYKVFICNINTQMSSETDQVGV